MSTWSCAWVQEDEGCDTWWSACSHGFTFNDYGPKDNGFKFCCYCGKPLEEVPWTDLDDDEGVTA